MFSASHFSFVLRFFCRAVRVIPRPELFEPQSSGAGGGGGLQRQSPCLLSLVVERPLRKRKVVGPIPTEGFHDVSEVFYVLRPDGAIRVFPRLSVFESQSSSARGPEGALVLVRNHSPP